MHIEIIQSGKIPSLIINLNSSVLFKRFSALVKSYPWCLPKRDPSEVCKILYFFQVYLLKLFCFVWNPKARKFACLLVTSKIH